MDFTFPEDAELVRQTVHEFVRRDLLPLEPKFLNARSRTERQEIARNATDKIREMGLYSAGVPEQFGGGGLGPIETCVIAEELSYTIIPVEWGDFTPILYECSDAQRDRYLLPVVSGEKNYALAFREPEPFPAPDQMKTTAESEGNTFRLNGIKELSRDDFDFCLVFARTREGVTCFLLNRDTPGAEIQNQTEPARLILNDCRIDADNILGIPGQAMFLGQRWFGLSRLSRSAAITGVCRRILETTALYARDWKSMNEPIINRREIQRTLAELAGSYESLRWLVYHTAWLAATGAQLQFDTMLLKLQAQTTLNRMVNDAIRVHGGTIPPIEHWLIRASAQGETLDMLRLAVSYEVIARYTS
ncbi:MAG: acyl-CoA dehydrogenase family protein [candidate division WOR-3 bacterium]